VEIFNEICVFCSYRIFYEAHILTKVDEFQFELGIDERMFDHYEIP
jgi:hypothetical protein